MIIQNSKEDDYLMTYNKMIIKKFLFHDISFVKSFEFDLKHCPYYWR